MEYNLVYEVGRLDAPGRPALFATTEEFLRRFGVGSTEDLPTLNPEAEEEIKSEVEEELQLRMEEFGEAVDPGDLAQEDSEPNLSEPDVLEPDVPEPDVSEPDVLEPAASEPDFSEPVISDTAISQDALGMAAAAMEEE